jgi:hypothetical protein
MYVHNGCELPIVLLDVEKGKKDYLLFDRAKRMLNWFMCEKVSMCI